MIAHVLDNARETSREENSPLHKGIHLSGDIGEAWNLQESLPAPKAQQE